MHINNKKLLKQILAMQDWNDANLAWSRKTIISLVISDKCKETDFLPQKIWFLFLYFGNPISQTYDN